MEKKELINDEFNVPYYIFEEIIDYIELTARGNNKCMKWNNILNLLNMAVINNKLTLEQAKLIKQTYCREE